MNDETPPSKSASNKNKKSQKRQRNWQIKIPCLEDEFNRASAAAASAGLSKAAYGRAKFFGGDPGPRSLHVPSVDAVAIRKVEGLHGRYGNNMNQIAFELHAYGERGLAADFDGALKEWAELRDYNLQAVGKLPPGRPLLSWKDLMAEGQEFLDANPGAETVCIPADLLRRIIGNGPNLNA